MAGDERRAAISEAWIAAPRHTACSGGTPAWIGTPKNFCTASRTAGICDDPPHR